MVHYAKGITCCKENSHFHFYCEILKCKTGHECFLAQFIIIFICWNNNIHYGYKYIHGLLRFAKEWYNMVYLTLKCFCACIDRLTKYMKGILNIRTGEWFKQVHLDMTSYYTHSLCIYGAQTPLGTSSSRRWLSSLSCIKGSGSWWGFGAVGLGQVMSAARLQEQNGLVFSYRYHCCSVSNPFGRICCGWSARLGCVFRTWMLSSGNWECVRTKTTPVNWWALWSAFKGTATNQRTWHASHHQE